MLLTIKFANHSDVQPDRTISYIVQSMYTFVQSISVPDFIGLTPKISFIAIIFFPVATAPSEPGLLNYRVFMITLRHTTFGRTERVIRPTQIPLPDIRQHPQETDIPADGGIRTRSSSKRATVDSRHRLCGHWDRPAIITLLNLNPYISYNVFYKINPIKTCKFFDVTLTRIISVPLSTKKLVRHHCFYC
jgi:hypothetical protein